MEKLIVKTKLQSGSSTLARAIVSGYQSQGFKAMLVMPTDEYAVRCKKLFKLCGVDVVSYKRFISLAESMNIKHDVVVFDDYDLMPDHGGNGPVVMLESLQEKSSSVPRFAVMMCLHSKG